jgi:hypothetical protein
MSNSERPETQAFRELEGLVRSLGDELARFRRRALVAEGRLGELDNGDEPAASRPRRDRLVELEQENDALRERLEAATARTRSMLERVHFLRQQTQSGSR